MPIQCGGHRENNRSMTMNKEEIYDSQISPLMQQVIAISKEHGIAMMARGLTAKTARI